MKLSLTWCIGGLVLTALGLALVFVASDTSSPNPLLAIFGMIVGVVIGPLTIISGLVVFVVRRPSKKELRSQNPRNSRTWHLRPVGALAFVVALAVCVGLGQWVGQYIPEFNKGGRWSPAAALTGLVMCGLLAIPKVRNLVFYVGERPVAKVGHQPPTGDAPNSTAPPPEAG